MGRSLMAKLVELSDFGMEAMATGLQQSEIEDNVKGFWIGALNATIIAAVSCIRRDESSQAVTFV